jgi:hypothetical protein
MRRTVGLIIFIMLLALGVQSYAAELKIVAPTTDQMAEGKSYYIKWGGMGAATVTITAEGNLTSRPGAPRGPFSVIIAENVPASRGLVAWTVPYLDTVRFAIHIVGYGAWGQAVAEDFKTYVFRPRVLRNRSANGIYIDLGNPDRQRLYVLRGNVLIRAYLTSGARTHVALPKPQRRVEPFDPTGVFRVSDKYPMYWSNLYQVWMTHAMRFWQGHFIHGTYPSEYYLLGHPASSGCIRLDRTDAEELYNMSPRGTRVEIFPY